MAQKLEEMMNEFRYLPVITTDKPIVSSGTITSTGGFFGASGALALIGDTGTGTVAGGSVVINTQRGIVTTGSLTTGTLAVTAFDLVDSKITATSQLFASVYNGSNTGGAPVVSTVQVAAAGSATVTIANAGGAALGALNGTLKINFLVAS